MTGENSAAIAGMWMTLVNVATPKQLAECIEKSPKVQSKIIPAMVNKQVKQAEEDESNMCRRLKVLYEKGLLSKEKYKAICRNIQAKFGKGISTPKLVYYDKLIAFIKSVNLDNVQDFAGTFCNVDASKFEEPINGSYRGFCSYIITLEELYILTGIDQALGAESFFQHFGSLPYHFRDIGADGAPFAKDDEATAWLVSFLNVGQHIQSEKDNFLTVG